MALLQILLTAASLAAAAGGTLGGERLLDRYGRPPAPEVDEAAPAREEREGDMEDARSIL